MVMRLTKKQLVATLSFVIVMVTSLVTIFLFGATDIVLAETTQELSIKVDGKSLSKASPISVDVSEVIIKSDKETWIEIPYSDDFYVTYFKEGTEYQPTKTSPSNFSLDKEKSATNKRNKVKKYGKQDSEILSVTENKKTKIYLRVLPDEELNLNFYRQSDKKTDVYYKNVTENASSKKLITFEASENFSLPQTLDFPEEGEEESEVTTLDASQLTVTASEDDGKKESVDYNSEEILNEIDDSMSSRVNQPASNVTLSGNERINIYNPLDTSTWIPEEYSNLWDFSKTQVESFGTSSNLNGVPSTGVLGTNFDFKGIPLSVGSKGIKEYSVNFGIKMKNVIYGSKKIDVVLQMTKVQVSNVDSWSTVYDFIDGVTLRLAIFKVGNIFAFKIHPNSHIGGSYNLQFYEAGTTIPANVKTSFIYGDQEGFGNNENGEQFTIKNSRFNSTLYPMFDFWTNNDVFYTGNAYLEGPNEVRQFGAKVSRYYLNDDLYSYHFKTDYYSLQSNGAQDRNVYDFNPPQAQWSFRINGTSTTEMAFSTSIKNTNIYPINQNYWNLLGFASIYPSVVPPTTKSVSDTNETNVTDNVLNDAHEKFNYTINTGFPRQTYAQFNLLSWQMADSLPPGVSLADSIDDIRVVVKQPDGTRIDITDRFNINYLPNIDEYRIVAKSATLSSRDMYMYEEYSRFSIEIPVRITDIDKVTRDSNGKILIKNQATVLGLYFNNQFFVESSNIVTTTVPDEQKLSVSKTVTKDRVEVDGKDPIVYPMPEAPNFEYGVTVKNTGTSDTLDNVRIFDTLPYSGDSRGTIFPSTGSYTANSVRVNYSGAEIYYNNKTFSTVDLDPNTVDLTTDGWTKYTGSVSQLSSAKSFIAVIPTLTKNQSATMTIGVTHTNQLGAVIKNNASANSIINKKVTSNTVQTNVLGRQLTGVAWYDDNGDGLIGKKSDGTNEEYVKDVPVKLYRSSINYPSYINQPVKSSLTGEVFIDSSGNSTVRTDANGKYQFSNLPEGNYVVEFLVGDRLVTENLEVTSQLVGSNNAINSKPDPITYKTNSYQLPILSGLSITPQANGLVAPFKTEYVNIGLKPKVKEKELSKVTLFKYKYGTATDSNKDGVLSDEEKATGQPLKNAEFALYKKETDELVDTKKTGSDGYVTFEGLSPGKYYLVETKSPDGYELVKQPIDFEITEGNQEIKLFVDDDAITKLPFTGSNKMKQLLVIGSLGLCVLGLSLVVWLNYRERVVKWMKGGKL